MTDQKSIRADPGKAKPEPVQPIAGPAPALKGLFRFCRHAQLGIMRGVRKNSNSCDVELTLLCRKRAPIAGKLPTNGT